MFRFACAILLTWCVAGTAMAGGLDDSRKGIEAVKRSEYDLVIHYFTRAIRAGDLSDKLLALVFILRGYAYYKKGQYDRAIDDFSTVIRLKPDDADAFNNRGIAYKKKGQYDRAIDDYNTAIRLKPDYTLVFNNRGYAYYKKGQYDRAIDDYTTAIRLKPDDAYAFNGRGFAYYKRGQYDRAIDDYSTVIRLKPDYPLAYNNLAWLYATADCAEGTCRTAGGRWSWRKKRFQ